MKITNINNTQFTGMISLYGKVNVKLPDVQIRTNNDIKKYQDEIEEIFTGKYLKNANFPLKKNSDFLTKRDYPLYGCLEIDTDRISAISDSEILLTSSDGKKSARVLYNSDNELRQLMAITAYNAASQNNIEISID